MKKIYDEIHGYVELGDVEVGIVDSPVFQRLRRVKQTSLAFIVYPGATHSRFSHSLGTYYLADKLGQRLLRASYMSDKEYEHLRLAALLHDVGQFPFSHSIEGYYLPKEFGNKDLREYVILRSDLRDVINDHGYDPRKILDIYTGNSILSSVIDSEVDVDRLDYLVRDSRHTGVQLGNIDLERLLDTITYREDGIEVLEKGIISLENFYISRLHMYQAVYYHKTILGYELFLRNIYSSVVEYCKPELKDPSYIRDMVDNGLIAYWDDEWVYSSMYECLGSSTVPQAVTTKIRNFLDRKGPKVVYEEVAYKGETSYISEIVDQLQRIGIPQESIYAFEEKISIIDKSKIRIISKNKEKKLKDYTSTLLHDLPEYIVMKKVYVDYEYSRKAREVLS
ncbi:MAG: HD domain-containing protein [Candidatus Aramenus sulfurataquae]|uniref:HD domain-containing protein n=3 Tax=Candidatus Aramenus sulfurataquae TaxID=1326980 RepID=A0AAE3FJK6_9CREN|nr:HD domain-containing protein [Candidatus Aramenus sulfurataquae]